MSHELRTRGADRTPAESAEPSPAKGAWELEAFRATPVGLADETAVANLLRWARHSKEAFAPRTLLAWNTDLRKFAYYCARTRQCALPADPQTLVRFVRFCHRRARRPATLRRYLASIGKAHVAAQLDNPCEHPDVRQALRAATLQRGNAQAQARGLVWEEIARYLALEPQRLRDVRDRAFVAVAYDTMCRSEELVGLEFENIDFMNGTAFIGRSKTDQAGEGAYCYLAPLTVRLLEQWTGSARIGSGALFRKVIGKGKVGEALRPPAAAEIFKRVGRHIRLPAEDVRRLTGHSARVGATQDQLAANIDVAAIMQSGRWKDPRMVARYGAKLNAQRSGMARLAALQGRA